MTSLSVADAQTYCTALTKKSGSNFYYSFLFLPKTRRAAMYTVYAFCKEVDNAVDEPPAGSNPQDELRRWRTELEAAYHGRPTFPVTISLAEHVKELSIPQTYFDELIKGVEMDLTASRYASFEDLSLYCYRVASVVGLICLHFRPHIGQSTRLCRRARYGVSTHEHSTRYRDRRSPSSYLSPPRRSPQIWLYRTSNPPAA